MNETAWKAIEEDKARRIPTPPIRTPVQWYQSGDKNIVIAGIITGIEGPGRVKLVIFPLNSFPQHKTGVYHEEHKIHEQVNNPTTTRCGSWGMEDGFKYPKEWYDLHDQEIVKREQGLRHAEDEAIKNSAIFAAKQIDKANGQKKRLPEILPAPSF